MMVTSQSLPHTKLCRGSKCHIGTCYSWNACATTTKMSRCCSSWGAQNYYTDSHGQTALHMAAALGHRAVVEWLLAHGSQSTRYKKGCLPRHLAASQGHAEIEYVKNRDNPGFLHKKYFLFSRLKLVLIFVKFERKFNFFLVLHKTKLA